MKTEPMLERLVASSLCVLLVSCSPTRSIVPESADASTHRVLVIRELAGGLVTHEWQRAEDIELSQYRYDTRAGSTAGRVVLVSSRQRDCHAEYLECIGECMSRPLPRGYGHVTSGGRKRGGKEEYCNRRCMPPYRDCMDLQDLRPLEFSVTDEATEWLKRNREAVLVGSIVVIAGVAFIAVSAGAGLLILAPAVLLASSEDFSAPCTAAVAP